jgi:hypothetical protein
MSRQLFLERSWIFGISRMLREALWEGKRTDIIPRLRFCSHFHFLLGNGMVSTTIVNRCGRLWATRPPLNQSNAATQPHPGKAHD